MNGKLVVVMVLAVALAWVNLVLTSVYRYERAWNPENLIRLHVVANSDSQQDQALKLQVRDAILAGLRPRLEGLAAPAARQVLEEHTGWVEELALSVPGIQEHAYPVCTVVGRFRFPHRNYREIALPAGEYYALRVVIGEGKGENWWCVLFPPLCFVDVATRVEGPALDNGGNALLIPEEELSEVPVKVRFVILEFLRKHGLLAVRQWQLVAPARYGRPDPQP
ncbi:MAG: stage II sporulation protein R [Bacillota bacterium]